MSFYLPIRLPVFWEETRRRLRGGRGFVVLSAYLLALLVLLLALIVAQPPGGPETWAEFGRKLWQAFYYGQIIVMFLIAPGLTASAISAEREHGSLDMLFLTRQTTFSLVMGKFLGAVTQMLVVILSGLPVIAIVFFYGGVSPIEVVKGYLVILLISLFYASLGFLASCLFKRIAVAVAWAYGFLLIHVIGFPLAIFSLAFLWLGTLEGHDQLMLHLTGPLELLLAYAYGDQDFSYWHAVAGILIQIVVVLAGCVLLMRRARGASALHLQPVSPAIARRLSQSGRGSMAG